MTSGLLLVPIEDEMNLERPFRGIHDGEQDGHLGEEIEMEFHKE